MTEDQLKQDLKAAMLAKNELKLSVLRMLQAAVTNKKKEHGAETISEAEIMEIIKKQVKQRKDSIAAFESGGRTEAAAKEQAEIDILQTYLPPELPDSEIEKVILAKKAELGISSKSDMGKLMGAAMAELKSKGVDGAKVKAFVEKALA